MKNFYLLLISFSLVLTFHPAKAASVVIAVEAVVFDPAVFTVNIGDTIIWMHSAGQHTTTSTSIPAGAASWDQVITPASPVFTYVPTVAGNYDYICSFHVSMGMTGHFTVLPGASAISEQNTSVHSLSGSINSGKELIISYNLREASLVNISLHDVIGNEVCMVLSQEQTPGEYNLEKALPVLSSGIYFMILVTKDTKLTKRIVIN